MRRLAVILLALGACVPDATAPGESRRDSARDGLYRDFLDGKFDEAGHPLGAVVWDAETACAGTAVAEGVQVEAGDRPVVMCELASGAIGRGRFTVNVRALAVELSDASGLRIVVRDAGGDELATREVPMAHFTEPLVYQNLPVTFTHRTDGAVRIEVEALGGALRIDHVELFRARRGVAISPGSGTLAGDDLVEIEVLDPPLGWQLELSCAVPGGELDLSEELEALIVSGEADRLEAEFRTLVTAPARLFEACGRPARVAARMVAGWRSEAARVTWRAGAPDCAFAAKAARRVLITGFEPFPADAWHGNSSEEAVTAYEPDDPGVSVMRLILPVEWQTAAAWVTDVIERCEPDVVIGFGQGRSAVDVETTAYNVMDSSDVSGGVPDNRGLVHGGTPIEAGGPAERQTRLPVDDILAELAARSVEAAESDDPGRYICNNLFYAIMAAVEDTGAVAGFIHLPYMARFGDAERALLADVVDTAVSRALLQ
jgi:pyroglutamyl-peptidase